MQLQELHFGIEIETIRRSRDEVAHAIQSVTGGHVRYRGGTYDSWEVVDPQGRIWKVVSDASLVNVAPRLRAEIVSPVLGYGDIATLQDVVRAVRRAGSNVDAQCAVHIHVDATAFDGRSLSNLAKIVYKQEALILTRARDRPAAARALHQANQSTADRANRTSAS